MAITIEASANSGVVRLKAGESIVVQGTLASGSATLTPKLSADGGSTYYPVSDPANITATVAFTATFGWIELKAPSKAPPTAPEYLFRLENSSGGTWTVQGMPAAAA